MKGNKASQYLRSIKDVTVSAVGVTARFVQAGIDKFDGTKEGSFQKLHLLLAPKAIKPADIPEEGWFEKGQSKKGDQGGRISWFFAPAKKSHHLALSFYTNKVCGKCFEGEDEWFQFMDGDHMHDFLKLLDITGIEPGISDYESKDPAIGKLRKKLCFVAFGVNPDYESADDRKSMAEEEADKARVALEEFKAAMADQI